MPDGRNSIPIVRTKLHAPHVSGDIVCRKRLHDHLDKGREAVLTLVAAPAGYGKSVLVSHWARGLDVPWGWISLDETDSDLLTFLSYFVAAIRTSVPGAVAGIKSLITAPNLPNVPLIAGLLVNEMEEMDSDLVLVLDDYHCIEPMSEVHELMRFLVVHSPPRLNIVITTRTDPPLPMVALRAGRLAEEVRVRDLQFTSDEVSQFLASTVAEPISEPALANLMQQTEGWAVGLQFVALYLRQAEDPTGFLLSLKGGVQHTQEYLLQEVLAKQPSGVRECMLRASILDRFSAELLDVICLPLDGSDEEVVCGTDLLDILDKDNLFTISLDAGGQWFRYHHLFQGFLTWELTRVMGKEEIATLNLRASEWFETQGLIAEAIRFAKKAGMLPRAAEIIERNRNREFLQDRWYVVERWLALLPDEFRQERPELLLAEAWTLYYRLRLERVSMLIEKAESLLEGDSSRSDFGADMEFFKGYLQYWAGNSPDSVKTLGNALSLAKDKESFCAAEIQIYLGLARCMDGQGERAIQELNELIEKAVSRDGLYFSHLIGGKTFVRLVRGELPLACSAADRLITVTRKDRMANTEAWGHYLAGSCHLAAGKLEAAIEQLTQATGKRYILDPMAVADGLVGLALAQQMLKMDKEADQTLDALKNFAAEADDPHCLAVSESGRARLAVLRGDHEVYLPWALSVDALPEPAELFIWMEVPAMTRVRVLIASRTSGELKKATALLRGMREVSEASRFEGQNIEIMVLQCLALELQGNTREALTILKEAVAAAETGGWVRPFLEAGPVMAKMLLRLDESPQDSHFTRVLLDSFGTAAPAGSGNLIATAAVDPLTDHLLSPLNELTHRERDVLELLARRLRNKEIADQLCVSLHTVNFHLKQIYSKLDVHNRRQAVDRAQEMGILKLRASD